MKRESSGAQGIHQPALRRPGHYGRVVAAVAIAVVVVVAGLGVYLYLSHSTGKATLVIYTYSSLFDSGGNDCGQAAPASSILDAFASAHHIQIQVQCPPGSLVTTLEAQENAPVADLVVGLDEITAPQAEAAGLLVPYHSSAAPYLVPGLASALSPDSAVTPYEYGYLGLDYANFFNHATGGAVANSSFVDLAANTTWARELVYSAPPDIVGEEFLAWQAVFYGSILHQDWTGFWNPVKPLARAATDWGTAFSFFCQYPTPAECQAASEPNDLFVSYITDPAYAVWAGGGAPSPYGSAVTTFNGTRYGWQTIYGVGIVKGTQHLTLDQEFVDYLLSPNVQAQVALNEWEYPANSTESANATHALFSLDPGLIDPATVVPLNPFTSPAELVQNFSLANPNGWYATWERIAG